MRTNSNENGNKLFSTTVDIDLALRTLATGLEIPLNTFQIFPQHGAEKPFYRITNFLSPGIPLSAWVWRLARSWELYEIDFLPWGTAWKTVKIFFSPGPGLCAELYYEFPEPSEDISERKILVEVAHFAASNWQAVVDFFSPQKVEY